MGALFSCCLKGGALEQLGFAGWKPRDNRRQALQSLLSDRDNPNVDGRKHCAPPPTAIREEASGATTPTSPSTGPAPLKPALPLNGPGRPDKLVSQKRTNYGGVQQKSVPGF